MNDVTAEPQEAFADWAILELMGHRRMAGFVTETTLAGAGVLRIDVPAVGEEPAATQYYAPSALYALTPATEEAVRAEMERRYRPAYASLPAPREPICEDCGMRHGSDQACYEDDSTDPAVTDDEGFPL